MINSRDIKDLTPEMQEKVKAFIERCDQAGIDLLVTSTYRDFESQTALYAQGRTTPGNKVTNAKAGESFHNYRIAVDVVPIINGKADWNSKRWDEIGAIGESCGLEWAGRWKSFKETAHFQLPGLTLAELKGGYVLGAEPPKVVGAMKRDADGTLSMK